MSIRRHRPDRWVGTTTGIGHAHGKGYSVEIMAKWMERIKTSFWLTDCIEGQNL